MEPIQVWPVLSDVPKFFIDKLPVDLVRAKSIDWVAYVPPSYESHAPDFLDTGINEGLVKIIVPGRGFMIVGKKDW